MFHMLLGVFAGTVSKRKFVCFPPITHRTMNSSLTCADTTYIVPFLVLEIKPIYFSHNILWNCIEHVKNQILVKSKGRVASADISRDVLYHFH